MPLFGLVPMPACGRLPRSACHRDSRRARHTVIVGEKQIGIAAAGEVGGEDRERPSRTGDAERLGPVLERPSPRLRSRYFRPPLFAYSKLSGMILVVFRCQRSTSSGQ
jgi:hypothetical protein